MTKKLVLCAAAAAMLVVGLIQFEKNIYYLGFVVPAIMFICGYVIYSVRHNMNSCCGFKTGASTRNEDTWELANRYCGRMFMKCSAVMLLISEAIMILMKPSPFIAEMMMLVMMVPVFVIMAKTEQEVNKHFDRQGNRKEIH